MNHLRGYDSRVERAVQQSLALEPPSSTDAAGVARLLVATVAKRTPLVAPAVIDPPARLESDDGFGVLFSQEAGGIQGEDVVESYLALLPSQVLILAELAHAPERSFATALADAGHSLAFRFYGPSAESVADAITALRDAARAAGWAT